MPARGAGHIGCSGIDLLCCSDHWVMPVPLGRMTGDDLGVARVIERDRQHLASPSRNPTDFIL